MADVPGKRATLPVVASAALRTRIHRDRLRAGDFLGSVPDLIRQMGVSRGTALEALRLLEHQGLIATRRGPRGGIFVAQPDATHVVAAMSALLDYEGTTSAAMSAARLVLEPPLARAAATHRSSRRVRAAIEQRLSESAAAMEDRRAFELSCAEFHVTVAAWGGNRPLALFAEVLQELTSTSGTTLRRFRGMRLDEVQEAHQHIADAILSGDGDAAERRMRRHLELSTRWAGSRAAPGSER